MHIRFGIAAIAVLVLAGCSGGSGDASGDTKKTDTKTRVSGEKINVGLCFDSGGKGDGSFNDSAFAGVERASKELGTETKTIDSKSEKDYETNLEALASSGCKVVFAVGFKQKTALEVVAPKHKDVSFGLIDDVSTVENVRSLVFSEEQGSFLAGYLAALTSQSGKVGFVGGQKSPLITKFESGFAAGIAYAGKSTFLPAKYTESWDDTVLGKASAIALYDQGADIVFHAAGRCGMGVIAAAKEKGKYAIGVDSDQDGIAKGSVLTSMIKRVDEAVFQTIKDVKAGKFTAGTKRFDLKSNGVGLSEMKFTKDKISPDVLKKVDAVKADIVSGKLVVPATTDELTKFTAGLKK